MCAYMDIEAMKRYPLEDFLARLGHHPVQRRANAIWYRSPYREEHTPSFKVNPEKNLWFDFGEGKGGNIFALAGGVHPKRRLPHTGEVCGGGGGHAVAGL